MPASSQAWISVMPSGTSCSWLLMISLGIRCFFQDVMHEGAEARRVLFEVSRILKVRRQQIVAMLLELNADRRSPFPGWQNLQNLLAGIEHGIDEPVSYTHLRAHETRHDLVC